MQIYFLNVLYLSDTHINWGHCSVWQPGPEILSYKEILPLRNMNTLAEVWFGTLWQRSSVVDQKHIFTTRFFPRVGSHLDLLQRTIPEDHFILLVLLICLDTCHLRTWNLTSLFIYSFIFFSFIFLKSPTEDDYIFPWVLSIHLLVIFLLYSWCSSPSFNLIAK